MHAALRCFVSDDDLLQNRFGRFHQKELVQLGGRQQKKLEVRDGPACLLPVARARAPSAVSGPIQNCSMACSPAYFDSHGRWTSSAPSDFNDGWVCPLWATSKHWCSARNATIGRRWVSPPECKVPSTLDLLGGAEVSSRRRHVFYFVGDSQMPDLHEGVCLPSAP